MGDKDTLDKTVAFLAKREGIDKVLKITRYTSRLIAATTVPGSELNARFAALESSIGTSRKAYRLGKFLQDLNQLRKLQVHDPWGLLEVATYTGEGVYYFMDQIVWLMKTGFISHAYEKRCGKISAWAEVLGYVANITLNIMRIRALQQQEIRLWQRMRKMQEDENVTCAQLEKEICRVRRLRIMRMAFVVQDLADSLLALNDIRSTKGEYLGHPVVLSLAGLLSAAVSTYKNWTA